MYDIYHDWGTDLTIGNGGDLALSSGSDAVRQRVCRRLLTNSGDYIWNVDYGGGLAQFVGRPAALADIEAIVRSQLALESAVPTTPAPQISIQIIDAANGYVAATISYEDGSSTVPIQLSVASG